MEKMVLAKLKIEEAKDAADKALTEKTLAADENSFVTSEKKRLKTKKEDDDE